MVTIPYLWLSLPVFSVPVLFQLPLSISHAFQEAGVTVSHRGTVMLCLSSCSLTVTLFSFLLLNILAKTTVKAQGFAETQVMISEGRVCHLCVDWNCFLFMDKGVPRPVHWLWVLKPVAFWAQPFSLCFWITCCCQQTVSTPIPRWFMNAWGRTWPYRILPVV